MGGGGGRRGGLCYLRVKQIKYRAGENIVCCKLYFIFVKYNEIIFVFIFGVPHLSEVNSFEVVHCSAIYIVKHRK